MESGDAALPALCDLIAHALNVASQQPAAAFDDLAGHQHRIDIADTGKGRVIDRVHAVGLEIAVGAKHRRAGDTAATGEMPVVPVFHGGQSEAVVAGQILHGMRGAGGSDPRAAANPTQENHGDLERFASDIWKAVAKCQEAYMIYVADLEKSWGCNLRLVQPSSIGVPHLQIAADGL